MKANVFSKPKGVLKGSSTMAAKGDRKGASPTRLVNNVGQKLGAQYFGSATPKNGKADKVLAPSKVKAMTKVMKAYPNTLGTPSAAHVVSRNESKRDMSKGANRNLKYIGK